MQLQSAGREPVSCMQAEKKEKELKRKGFSSEAQINKSRSFFKVPPGLWCTWKCITVTLNCWPGDAMILSFCPQAAGHDSTSAQQELQPWPSPLTIAQARHSAQCICILTSACTPLVRPPSCADLQATGRNQGHACQNAHAEHSRPQPGGWSQLPCGQDAAGASGLPRAPQASSRGGHVRPSLAVCST